MIEISEVYEALKHTVLFSTVEAFDFLRVFRTQEQVNEYIDRYRLEHNCAPAIENYITLERVAVYFSDMPSHVADPRPLFPEIWRSDLAA